MLQTRFYLWLNSAEFNPSPGFQAPDTNLAELFPQKATRSMDVNKTVHLRENYLIERIDGEISVYHPTLTTAVYLNETGALIWELCDGKRSVAEIVDILGDLYPESRTQIDGDVRKIIAQLIKRNIAELR